MRSTLRLSLLAALVSLPLAACSGKKEADRMTQIADEMCACKTFECIEKLFPEAEKFTKENEGKEVSAEQADRYNKNLDRAQKCYDKLAAEGAKAEEKAEEKKGE